MCLCLFINSYLGEYSLPLDVTSQDAMHTVSWASLYWNLPIQLLWLRRNPQRCTCLSLYPTLGLQTCAITECMGSEEESQVLMFVRTVGLSCLIVPCSSLRCLYPCPLWLKHLDACARPLWVPGMVEPYSLRLWLSSVALCDPGRNTAWDLSSFTLILMFLTLATNFL